MVYLNLSIFNKNINIAQKCNVSRLTKYIVVVYDLIKSMKRFMKYMQCFMKNKISAGHSKQYPLIFIRTDHETLHELRKEREREKDNGFAKSGRRHSAAIGNGQKNQIC